MLKTNEKIICCFLAIIMFFMGMCLETTKADSSFSCAAISLSDATISSVDYITDDVETCTLDMLNKSTVSVRGNMANAMNKWQSRAVLIFFIAGISLQYLFYYQSAECKEDGQLLLCRSVAINYIHQKDGEK